MSLVRMIRAAQRVRAGHGGLRAAARGHDRGLRRRPEQRGQLRIPGRDRAAYIGSVLASDCPDLTACPPRPLGGGPGALRRPDLLRHPPRRLRRRAEGDPHHSRSCTKARPAGSTAPPGQGRQETGRAGRHLARQDGLPREKVEAEIEKITAKPWVRRVITWQLSGDQPKDLRLAWQQDLKARAALEDEIFGKHVLITDHHDWPVAEVVAGTGPSPRPSPASASSKTRTRSPSARCSTGPSTTSA